MTGSPPRRSVGYEFPYWLKRAFGASGAGPALRAALARRPRAPHPVHPSEHGKAPVSDQETSARRSLVSWSPSASQLTSEPPTRCMRICTSAPGRKGAARRRAMASGHPCPRTPTSKRAGYRVGGPPLAGDTCGDECDLQQPEQPQPTKAQIPCRTRGFAVGDVPDDDSAGCGFESHGAYTAACVTSNDPDIGASVEAGE
jgi:hypothetical protein